MFPVIKEEVYSTCALCDNPVYKAVIIINPDGTREVRYEGSETNQLCGGKFECLKNETEGG